MNETLQNGDSRRTVSYEPAKLVVWESDGSWARHLRRLLGPEGPRVYEARTFQACRTMIAESPASIVVALWTESTSADVVRLAGCMRRKFPAARILAVADRKAEPHRWQILETGIVWLCTSPRELTPLVEIIGRHLEQVPEPPLTPEQRIWARLPWPRTVERAGTGRS